MFSATKSHQFGLSESMDLQILLDECKANIPNCDEKMIRLAFNYCIIAHEGKLRKSGAKYYTHPLSVAFIVIQEIPLDNESVIAALLHNVLDESDIYTYEDLRFTFGATVAQILESITRIKFVESQHIDRPDQVDNYRKLLLTLFTDIRIILIKLADKLDNMRTLQYVSSESQIKIARETLDIYAPFANRFGLTRIKFELEDLSFKYLNPDIYKQIEDTIKGTHDERTEYVERFKEPIEALLDAEQLLKKENVTYRINGRAKNIYSIYNKTLIRGKNVDELYDIFAIRIILDTDNPLLCFYVYGIVAHYYMPMLDTFKDYISNPKENGYSSLHIAVAGPGDRVVEVQIRTEQMHHSSEVGVAAHFRYKSGVKSEILEDNIIQKWLDEVREIFETIGSDNSSKILGLISNNNLQDKIYVFTPRDEFRQLPKGATALDFAFDIHTDIGLSCISVKVNGKFFPINHKLNSGDKVEIISSKTKAPSPEWIDYVVTPKATSALLHYFKNKRKETIKKGKELWHSKNKEYGFVFSNEEMTSLLNNYHFKNESDFFESLGNNTIHLDKEYRLLMAKIISRIQFEMEHNYNDSYIRIEDNFPNIAYKPLNADDNYEFDFPKCCYPLPGDTIFGIVDNGTVDVHSVECSKHKKLLRTHPDDLISLNWEHFQDRRFIVSIRVVAEDRERLIPDIISKIINNGYNRMLSVSYDTHNSTFTGDFIFQITNTANIYNIINSIEQMKDIKRVDIVHNT
ncbi:MAG: RelA/SpoT family protein [Ignavibacteria bacterium]|jgi:RelA/SpoT family (p)ppGpp synthetase|nr:RelA/SpoT family protein [Ignavibacteria bacterium]